MPAMLGLELFYFKRMSMELNILLVTSLKKFDKGQKNHSTSKKEFFALVLALQHFKIYVSAGGYLVTVYTDHNP